MIAKLVSGLHSFEDFAPLGYKISVIDLQVPWTLWMR